MHHQDQQNIKKKNFFSEISPIETNTNAIQVQECISVKNSQKCKYLELYLVLFFLIRYQDTPVHLLTGF